MPNKDGTGPIWAKEAASQGGCCNNRGKHERARNCRNAGDRQEGCKHGQNGEGQRYGCGQNRGTGRGKGEGRFGAGRGCGANG